MLPPLLLQAEPVLPSRTRLATRQRHLAVALPEDLLLPQRLSWLMLLVLFGVVAVTSVVETRGLCRWFRFSLQTTMNPPIAPDDTTAAAAAVAVVEDLQQTLRKAAERACDTKTP